MTVLAPSKMVVPGVIRGYGSCWWEGNEGQRDARGSTGQGRTYRGQQLKVFTKALLPV